MKTIPPASEAHSAALGAKPEAAATLPLWEVSTYRGLFHPGATYRVEAASKYEAECLATELLAPDEWFPTFSALSASNGLPDESSLAVIPA